MTKGFSLGDLNVNQQAADGASSKKFSLEELNTGALPNDEEIKKDKSVKNFIPIQKNSDGSLKYTFDNIYDNEQLISVAKDYYANRDRRAYSDKEAVDKFISDRTWNQANTLAMGNEFLYVTGENFSEDQKARLSYLTRYWSELPNFYEEGGRGASGFFANLGVGLLDPLNIVGAGVGGIVGKQVLKKAGQEVIKSQVKKKAGKKVVEKTVAKEILNSPEEFSKLSASVKKEALLKGSASMAGVEGAGFGTIDIANQLVEKEIDLRETLDPIRTGTVALTATGLGFFVPVTAGYLGNKIINLKLARNNNLPDGKMKNYSKKSPDNTNKSESLNSEISDAASSAKTNLADQWDFIKVLQKELTGVEGDVASLKKLYKSGDFKTDPILEPYFQLRMLAASSTRANAFIMDGVYLPPSAVAKSASYIKGKSIGLHEILKTFDQNNEVNEFLGYVAAKRMQFISKRKPNLDKTLPMDKATRNEFIDFAELTSSAYKKKYGKDLVRKSNFTSALVKYKQFTDELLEYQVQSGLLARKDAKKILKENPFFIPLTRDKLADTGVIGKIKQQTQKLLGLSRPGAVKLAQQKQEGDINLYKNLVNYTYQTVLAGDKNRAKLAFYNMIQKAEKLGKIDKDSIVKLVTGNQRVRIQNVPIERITKAYTKAGAKFDPDKDIPIRKGKKRTEALDNLDSLDVITFSDTFRKSDSASADFADIVYRNGKAEIYEIKDPNLAEAFKGLGDAGAERLFNMFGEGSIFSRYARFASQAITYSPPFVAFNVIRDTLAGTVNSAFGIVSGGKTGFIPGFTSAKGYINTVRHTDQYKKALLNGLGYSSRSETANNAPRNIKALIENGATLGVLKSTTDYYKKNLARLILRPAGYGARKYKNLVQSAEYATRMGEYQLAKAAGFSDIAASFAGREVATDFGMRGSSSIINAINRNTMFFNASIQGLYRTGRVLFEQPKRAAAVITATIVAPEIALYHLNNKHKEYSLVPNQVKQLNYLIPNYTVDENGQKILDPDLPFYAIPKPYDLGVFANVATGLIDGMYKKSNGVTAKYIAESFSLISPGMPIPSGIRPAIEVMFNKNLYSGAPVIGIYEMRRINELQFRPTTRKLARELTTMANNLSNFVLNTKEGALESSMSPITVDYLLGAYLTGMSQYPLDIINSGLEKFTKEKIPGAGVSATKREDEADLSSLKNAISIVTRRFKVASPIKNSQYHQEWRKIINRAKKLKQIDYTQMDLEKRNKSFLVGLGIRTLENIEKFGGPIEEEALVFSRISPILKDVEVKLLKLRENRNDIRAGTDSPDIKRQKIDAILAVENQVLEQVINALANEDIDFVFDQTFTDNVSDLGVLKGSIASIVFGLADRFNLGLREDTVKKNPNIKN